MKVIPVGPGFAAELRDVTLAEIATNDDAYREARAAIRAALRPGVSRPGSVG